MGLSKCPGPGDSKEVYMKFEIEKVLERDIDLYVINRFIYDENFKQLFLNKIKRSRSNFNVVECKHSVSNENGESDIIIILENKNKRIGLLIEDKIDAPAMPNQYKRYKKRAEDDKKNGLYDEYFIFIIAPQQYLDNNSQAKNYNYKISYEDILSIISDDLYGKTLIEKALDENQMSYTPIENKPVTAFWKKYYNLVEQEYKNLNITKHEGARGSQAHWAIFKTPVKNIHIVHKANKGYVDLTFPGLAQQYKQVKSIIKKQLPKDNELVLEKTSKSVILRRIVPIIDFKSNFEKQKNDVIKCLNVIVDLQNLLNIIGYDEILDLKK